MAAVFIPVYRQLTLPKINEERSVQGQINQIIRCAIVYSTHVYTLYMYYGVI